MLQNDKPSQSDPGADTRTRIDWTAADRNGQDICGCTATNSYFVAINAPFHVQSCPLASALLSLEPTHAHRCMHFVLKLVKSQTREEFVGGAHMPHNAIVRPWPKNTRYIKHWKRRNLVKKKGVTAKES